MVRLILTVFSCIPLFLISGNYQEPLGPRSASLGHASACLTDVWSTRNNQANLAFIKQPEAGVFVENRFFIKELNQSGFAVASPIKKGAIALAYSSFGYKLYKQSHANIAYALKLSEQVAIGISLDYLNTRIGDIYGQAHSFTGAFGLTAKVLPQLVLSTHIYNPFRVQLATYNNERIPSTFKIGGQYLFSEKIFLVGELEKKSLQKANVKAGIEYKPSSMVYLRVGVSSYPTQAHFGFGVSYNNLQIDISSKYHSTLGFSPQLGLSYGLHKTSKKTDTTK